MDRQLHDWQVRRARGQSRVTGVTSAVAVAATGLAVVLGVVFARETTSTATTDDDSTGTGDSGTYSGSDSGTESGTDDGWPAPDSVPGGSGSAHGSSGGS